MRFDTLFDQLSQNMTADYSSNCTNLFKVFFKFIIWKICINSRKSMYNCMSFKDEFLRQSHEKQPLISIKIHTWYPKITFYRDCAYVSHRIISAYISTGKRLGPEHSTNVQSKTKFASHCIQLGSFHSEANTVQYVSLHQRLCSA